MIITPSANNACPCNSSRGYGQCCGRYHAGVPAPDAEALMRSRYSAFVLADQDYLLATWHPSTRPATVDLPDAAKTKWLGLEVKQTWSLSAANTRVQFVARFRIGGASATRLHEVSEFVREDGRWYYLGGELS